jgi:hypothetical protein
MPLCTPRDRRPRCAGAGRLPPPLRPRPEGMWLPECAVDTATLEALAAGGVAFTILAPHQAARVRPPGGRGATSTAPSPAGSTAARCRRGARSIWLLRRAAGARGRVRAAAHDGGGLRAKRPGRRRPATPRRCATSPPTARPTATTIATATWRWRGRSRRSRGAIIPARAHHLRPVPRHAPGRPGRWRSARTRRGAARTASSAGAATAAATAAGAPAGTRRGGSRCGPRSTGCAGAPTRCSTASARPVPRSVGRARRLRRRAAGRRRRDERFLARPRAARRRSGARARADGAERATRWRCTRAAAGSSTTSAASRPCRSFATPRGCASWARLLGGAPLEAELVEALAAARSNDAAGRRRPHRCGSARSSRPGSIRPSCSRATRWWSRSPATSRRRRSRARW